MLQSPSLKPTLWLRLLALVGSGLGNLPPPAFLVVGD
jgi:hypothetical protein